MPFKVINVANTKGKCGVKDIPVINVPETARYVEVVVQNLSPAAHVLHMHGMPFKVINVANYTSWCRLNHTACFGLPWWDLHLPMNKCPPKQRKPGDPNNKNIKLGGCCRSDSKSRPCCCCCHVYSPTRAPSSTSPSGSTG